MSVPLLFVAAAFGQTTLTPPSTTFTTSSSLPPVGLASSETAQVNVVNTAAASSSSTAASCTGTIAFYNAAGTIIGTATKFTVGSGEIFSATLPYESTGGSGARTVVRAVITTTIAQGQLGVTTAVPSCTLTSSLETYDTGSGVTHAFVSGAVVSPVTIFARNPIAP